MPFNEIDDVLWESIEPYLPPQSNTYRKATGRYEKVNERYFVRCYSKNPQEGPSGEDY